MFRVFFRVEDICGDVAAQEKQRENLRQHGIGEDFFKVGSLREVEI